MKKTIQKSALTSIVTILGAFAFAIPVMAATTASLSPAVVNITPGQTFNVVVAVNPQGVSNYAEKLEIDYPADTLEVTSFTFSSNWMALTQPGYDSTDNTNGVLVKTAGYPGGFSSSLTFGTVSFHAKKAGSGIIKIGNSSLAFEANSQTVITGSGATFAVTAPAIAPAPVVTPKKAVQTTVTPTPASTGQATEVTPAQTTGEVNPTSQQPQVAAVAAANTGGSSMPMWAWLALIAILVIGGGWWAYNRFSRTK